MQALTIALRIVHFAAIVALFGEFVFHAAIALPSLRKSPLALRGEPQHQRARLTRHAWSWLAIAFVSGFLWLVVQSASMSGLPFERAFDPQILGLVLTQTLFGQVWTIRAALVIVVAACIVLVWRSRESQVPAFVKAGVVLTGALLATVAWAGHAAGEAGNDRIVHLVADIAHLLAAGAWLGALLPFAVALSRMRAAASLGAFDVAVQTVRRFSMLGIVSVATLAVSGVVNALYTVGTIHGLFGTVYGLLVLVKVMLFSAMVAVAGFNRKRLTPRLSQQTAMPVRGVSLHQLARNARIEAGIGLVLLAVVGWLGVTIPALHEQVVWPYPYTLDDTPARMISPAWWPAPYVVLAASIALLFAARRYRRSPRIRAVAFLGTASIVLAAGAAWFAIPAHPTTYQHSAVPFNVVSIANGAASYRDDCATCHGPLGHDHTRMNRPGGDGPMNLAMHLFERPEGDVLWTIEHGIPGTAMPAFGDRIDTNRAWEIINAVRAVAEASGMTSGSALARPMVAPELNVQIAGGPQQSLAELRTASDVLLVFYSFPASAERLRELAASSDALRRAGARVVALPVRIDESTAATPPPESLAATASAHAAATYALYANGGMTMTVRPDHMEFLIDRNGVLRAIWSSERDNGWEPLPQLVKRIALVDRTPSTPIAASHVH